MGWNRLNPPGGAAGHPLLDGIEPGAHVYFVHGYAAPVSENTVAACSYAWISRLWSRAAISWGRSSTPSVRAPSAPKYFRILFRYQRKG